jgi:hypothetical protein
MLTHNGVTEVSAVMCRGLEKVLDQIEAERPAGPAGAGGEGADRDVRRVLMREKRAQAWRHLTLAERDVLTVLTAICKVHSHALVLCTP